MSTQRRIASEGVPTVRVSMAAGEGHTGSELVRLFCPEPSRTRVPARRRPREVPSLNLAGSGASSHRHSRMREPPRWTRLSSTYRAPASITER
jgi:hypothetical protein